MSGDWIDELTPEERQRWDDFVTAFRRDAVEKLMSSAAFLSLVPTEDGVDVKFCAELGTAIMLDKPIIAVVLPGRTIPNKLREIADEVVEADLDTSDGQAELARRLERVFK